MSRDGHPLLMCDVNDPMPTAGHMQNTACSTVVGVYHVYRAVSWQCFDQTHHNTLPTNPMPV
jgi:hypothetical protein